RRRLSTGPRATAAARAPVHLRGTSRPPGPPSPPGRAPVGPLGPARGPLVQGGPRGLRPQQGGRPLRAPRLGVFRALRLEQSVAAADQQRIVATARTLIEAGGVEALSMRK